MNLVNTANCESNVIFSKKATKTSIKTLKIHKKSTLLAPLTEKTT